MFVSVDTEGTKVVLQPHSSAPHDGTGFAYFKCEEHANTVIKNLNNCDLGSSSKISLQKVCFHSYASYSL